MELRVRQISGVISTDDIIPGRIKHMFTDPKALSRHVFDNMLPGFAATLGPDDVLCGDDTFGIGSSREQAVSALQAAGIRAVIAPSFGRIFFRNAWNLGLIAIEMPAFPGCETDRVTLHLGTGALAGPFGTCRFQPPDPAILAMVAQGGLLAMVQKRLQAERAARQD